MTSTPKETTTKVEPWDGAKGYLLDQYKNFDQLLKDGAPKPYAGNTYNEQSQQTKDALTQAENIARNGNTSVLNNANTAVNNVLNQNGNTQANQTLSQLQSGVNLGTNPTDAISKAIASGTPSAGQSYTNPAAGQASNLNGYSNAAAGLQSAQANSLAGSNNPAMQYLQGTASGANIGNNPYLDSMVSNQQDKIAEKLKNVTNPALTSQAASLGRMGSGAFASQLNNANSTAANEMSKVATDLYANQYNTDVQNQMSAASQFGNFANQDVSNRMNANAALSQTDNAQQAQRLAGTQLYGNLNSDQQQQRQAALNGDRSYQLSGLSQLGSNYQNNIQNMLSSNSQKMNAATAQQAGQNAMTGQQLQAASMAGSIYGNQYLPAQQLAGVGADRDAYNDLVLQSKINAFDRTQQQPLQNIGNFVNLLNGGGYSNTTTPVYSNTGAQVLGGLSSLAGLFALCSKTVKTIHSFIGYMPLVNGGQIPIYQFSYTDDPDHKLWVGPIAEEVEEQLPDTVVEFTGKKHIDVAAFIKEAA